MIQFSNDNADGAGMDTHEMTLYTERTHSMTKLFFDNLQVHWFLR